MWTIIGLTVAALVLLSFAVAAIAGWLGAFYDSLYEDS